MENENQNLNQTTNETPNVIPAEVKTGGNGAVIGAIIIIIIIIAGGWYFISNRLEKIEKQKQETANQILTGSSTEITDIQTDLDNVDLNILD